VLALVGVLLSGFIWLAHGTGNSGTLLAAVIFWVLSFLPSVAFLCRTDARLMPMLPVIFFSGLLIFLAPMAVVISDNTKAGFAFVIAGLIAYVIFGLGWAAEYYPLFSVYAGFFWSTLGGLNLLIILSVFVSQLDNGFWKLCQGRKALGIGVSAIVLGTVGDVWVLIVVLMWMLSHVSWEAAMDTVLYSCLLLIPFLVLGSVMAGVHGELKGDNVYLYMSDPWALERWQLEMQCVNAPGPDEEEKWRSEFVEALDLDSETGMEDAQKKLDDFIRGRTRDIYRSYFICVFAQALFNFTLLVGMVANADKNDYSP
jgi:hypothetical protein